MGCDDLPRGDTVNTAVTALAGVGTCSGFEARGAGNSAERNTSTAPSQASASSQRSKSAVCQGSRRIVNHLSRKRQDTFPELKYRIDVAEMDVPDSLRLLLRAYGAITGQRETQMGWSPPLPPVAGSYGRPELSIRSFLRRCVADDGRAASTGEALASGGFSSLG
jgi:hypothetical protein